jgi:hypothetical protein
MAKNPSFKEFMDQVEMRLGAYSLERLQEMIMGWAKNTHPSKRIEFLANLATPPATGEIPVSDEELLGEISALAKRIKNGDFCDGWGWDDAIHEERDFGDESWADELDDLFNGAHDAMAAGNYKLAKDAYTRLFDTLEMGDEPGHLPGAVDAEDMLDTDLGEARAEYLRSIYLSSLSRERPAALLRVMQRFGYHLGEELNLQSVVNAGRNPLPDFTQFLQEWIDLLKKTNERSASYLLREAITLSGGTPAIEKLARDEGNRYPKAYVDWIKALEKDGDFRSMLAAAKVGLANVPKDYTVRAEIAEGMIRSGVHLDDWESQLTGWREAFYSNPSLSYLLSLCSLAEQKGRQKEEIGAAINRIALLIEKNGKYQARAFNENNELREAAASESLLNQAYLLAGRYQDAFYLCKSKGVLGWSDEQNPKGLVIPFFLVILSKGKKTYPTPNLDQLWEESLKNTGGYSNHEHGVVERFEKAMENVFYSINLSNEEENKYLDWCVEETGHRVDAIVGAKDRDSYDKAATLLVALAEMLASRGRKSTGVETISKYIQKYSRHRKIK